MFIVYNLLFYSSSLGFFKSLYIHQNWLKATLTAPTEKCTVICNNLLLWIYCWCFSFFLLINLTGFLFSSLERLHWVLLLLVCFFFCFVITRVGKFQDKVKFLYLCTWKINLKVFLLLLFQVERLFICFLLSFPEYV